MQMATQSANPPQILTLDEWEAGLNQQGRRASIGDNESWWNENLFGIGTGNLRSLWGASAPIYTAPAGTQILRIFFGYYGNTTPPNQPPPPGRLGWMFLSEGTIDEVDLDTHQTSGLRAQGPIWNPIAPYYWASAKVWRPRFVGATVGQIGGVLFGSPESPGNVGPGGLYAWDGSTLYPPGSQAPDWLTNAAETPYPVNTTMPVGLPGIYTMEVYQGRLFVA